MSSAPILDVVRSRPVRLGAGFAALLVVTITGIFVLMYTQVSTANLEQVSQLLGDEARAATGTPTDELQQQLALRLTRDLRRLDFVGLFDAEGHLVYGNVSSTLPVPVDGKPHVINLTLPDTLSAVEAVVFVARRRTDGGVVLLGRSLVGVYRLNAAMRQSYWTAVLPIVLVAIVVGLAFGSYESRRLHAIETAIARVMSGDIEARLPRDRRGDDIGAVVRAVNLMLDGSERLVRQLKAVGDNVAHDLKTPLAAMRVRLERGLATTDQTETRAAVSHALGDLDRALRTSTAILRIAELRGTADRRSFSRVDLEAIARDTIDLFEPLAGLKGIALSLETAGAVPILGDAGLLQEILVVLLDNAVKYTPRGGSIAMRVRLDPVLFRISDTGPGIPDERRSAVFARYERLTQTQHIAGSGLGLSIASAIADLHRLTLRIVDGEVGTTFELVTADGNHPREQAAAGSSLI